jgi:nickel-dependent lactate racemase
MNTTNIQSIHGPLAFNIPVNWQVLTHAMFRDPPVKGTAAELAATALNAPLNAPPLNQQLAAGNTVAILIEDLTRSSPKQEILPVLLHQLDTIGIPPKNIRIVIALGTHRALSKAELANGYGADITARYRFINHDCQAADLVTIGRLQSGRTVKINRHVYEADFRIGVGSIFPHPLNGFGGGGKILFPGVADFESIFEHHLKYSFVGQARLGNIDGNEFFQEVDRLARAGRLDFVINSVLDHRDRLYDLVCGDPQEAYQAGIRICKKATGKAFERQADVTVISAFPYTEGPQIMKPLAPASDTTRKGGCIILYADCCQPLPEIYFRHLPTVSHPTWC